MSQTMRFTGFKRVVSLSAAVSSAALGLGAVVDAVPPDGDEQRIEFAPGTDNATVHGDVGPGASDRYVLRAAADQVMSVATDSPNFDAVITVYGTDGRVMHSGHVTASVFLPADGDYVVEVSSAQATAYALTVQIHDATPPPPGPDSIQRIEFEPGTDRGAVEGTVAPGAVHRYVLWAAAGQTMSIDLDSTTQTAEARVFDPTGNEVIETITGFALPRNGDYLVEVTSPATATYALNVIIPDSTGFEERIEFAPGTNHESVTGDIVPATTDRYVLWAAMGQTMVVHLSSVTGNIFFSISGPDGTPLSAVGTETTVVLPGNGDYVVEVGTTSSGGPYRVSFWIE